MILKVNQHTDESQKTQIIIELCSTRKYVCSTTLDFFLLVIIVSSGA